MNSRFQICLRIASLLVLVFKVANADAPVDAPPKILNLADYGAKPDSKADVTEAFQQAFAEAGTQPGNVVLQIPKGQYELFTDKATKKEYHISNTSDESVNQTKVIGLYLKGLKNLTIDGNGSLIFCHGKMTIALLDSCENVTIRNLHFDFVRPTVSEITVKAVEGNTVDFQVNADSTYKLEQNKIIWTGEGWQSSGGIAQEYDPVKDTTWRCSNPVQSAQSIVETGPHLLRITYGKPLGTKIGHIFQIRDGTRDEVGMLLLRSRNIILQDLGMHFMHGLGIVGQFSDMITLDGVDCEPRPEADVLVRDLLILRTSPGVAEKFSFLIVISAALRMMPSIFMEPISRFRRRLHPTRFWSLSSTLKPGASTPFSRRRGRIHQLRYACPVRRRSRRQCRAKESA